MKTVNNILLVRVPAEGSIDGRELRDYILESLSRGVLVLADDATCEVMELPPLGGVEVAPSKTQEAAAAPETQEEPKEEELLLISVPSGQNRGEKLAILTRLREYRRAHGLGCWDEVAKKAGKPVTPELIRAVVLSEESPPIAVWRQIDRALQALNAKEAAPC